MDSRNKPYWECDRLPLWSDTHRFWAMYYECRSGYIHDLCNLHVNSEIFWPLVLHNQINKWVKTNSELFHIFVLYLIELGKVCLQSVNNSSPKTIWLHSSAKWIIIWPLSLDFSISGLHVPMCLNAQKVKIRHSKSNNPMQLISLSKHRRNWAFRII